MINKKYLLFFAGVGFSVLFSVAYHTKPFLVSSRLSYGLQVFPSDNGYGYQIVKNNNILIHQPFIPAIQGNIPFTDKSSARKVGKMVIHKIQNNQLPSITPAELRSVKIIE
ncbi:MAG: DUF4907 domain-containing protein [Bacteroidales bacterium]|nr:DUF4907 domain-containing protein [Bacteroidales bacterium]